MTTHPSRRRGLLGLVSALLGLVLLVVAAPLASAHVRVDGQASPGGYSVLTFRVPTESDTASTPSLKVTFPSSTPITSVSTQPKAGWKASVSTKKLSKPVTTEDGSQLTTYVSTVTWKATGHGIAPGEFDTFAVSAGPIPDTSQLSFPAEQGYSDGSVVKWNQIQSGDTEPEHPAPTLTVTKADASAASAPVQTASGPGTAWGISGAAAGFLALVLSAVALWRTRRGTPRHE